MSRGVDDALVCRLRECKSGCSPQRFDHRDTGLRGSRTSCASCAARGGTRARRMAKAAVRRTKRSRGGGASRTRDPRAGWVRKNVVMNQRKLDAARRALGVETEAIDLALDFVAFRREVARGISTVRWSGGVDDVFCPARLIVS